MSNFDTFENDTLSSESTLNDSVEFTPVFNLKKKSKNNNKNTASVKKDDPAIAEPESKPEPKPKSKPEPEFSITSFLSNNIFVRFVRRNKVLCLVIVLSVISLAFGWFYLGANAHNLISFATMTMVAGGLVLNMRNAVHSPE